MSKRAITVTLRLGRAVAILTTVGALGLGALAATAGAASASILGDCRTRQTSTPFAPWGDSNAYFAMRGGTFESGGTGWTLDGASVVSENESFFVNDPGDTQSLSLPDGSQATSPTICVGVGEDTVRLFVKSSGGADSILHVQASVADPLTGLVFSTGVDVNGGDWQGQWLPTDPISIPNFLGELVGKQQLTLVFTTSGTPATWNIDDVYVDPFKSH